VSYLDKRCRQTVNNRHHSGRSSHRRCLHTNYCSFRCLLDTRPHLHVTSCS